MRRPRIRTILLSALAGGLVVTAGAIAGVLIGLHNASIPPKPATEVRAELTVSYPSEDGTIQSSTVRLGDIKCRFLGESLIITAASTRTGEALAGLGDERRLSVFTVRFDDKVFLADKLIPISGERLVSAPIAGWVGLWKDDEVVGSVSNTATLDGDLTCTTVDR